MFFDRMPAIEEDYLILKPGNGSIYVFATRSSSTQLAEFGSRSQTQIY